ncbi:S8 family serine peptidase [Lysinibacillus sphaericus]|uniref:S8 family serine peptidase n=1 Tax=Lysinibacillus sphaericus TaxID=1421 RepID=UPI003D7FAF02
MLLSIFLIGCSSKEASLDSIAFSSKECEQNWVNLDILEGKVKETYNAINKNSETLDELGHGTLIAPIIAAEENSHNIIGVNPDAELYDVQVLNSKGVAKLRCCLKENRRLII